MQYAVARARRDNLVSSRFLDSARAIVSLHGERLSSLVGQRLTDVLVVWDRDDNSWFADEPVVLVFGDTRLAIVFWKTHEVALEWNQVDISKAPNWFGCYEDLNLEWRPCELATIRATIGKRLEDVTLVENCETLQVLVDPLHPDNEGNETSNWYPYALSFHLGGSILTVFNALDENGVANYVPVAAHLRASSINTLTP